MPNALRREVVRQFAILTGGDPISRMQQVPFVTRIYDTLVERFTQDGWPSDERVIEAVKKEVERYV